MKHLNILFFLDHFDPFCGGGITLAVKVPGPSPCYDNTLGQDNDSMFTFQIFFF